MNGKHRPEWVPASDPLLKDQIAGYDQVRSRCPVAHSEQLHWSLFRHEDVVRVMRRYAFVREDRNRLEPRVIRNGIAEFIRIVDCHGRIAETHQNDCDGFEQAAGTSGLSRQRFLVAAPANCVSRRNQMRD